MSGRGYRAAGFMDGFMNGFEFVDGLRRADEEREYRRGRDKAEEFYLEHLPDLRKVRRPAPPQTSGLQPTLEKAIGELEGIPPYIRNDRLLDHLQGAYGLLPGGVDPTAPGR